MLNNLTSGEIALASFCLLFGLSLIVWLDRYFTRRRSAMMNADHLARIYAEALSGTIHEPRFQNELARASESDWSEQTHNIAGANVVSFSRRRVMRDRLGRILVIHYEEILTPDLEHGVSLPHTHRPLLLAPAA